MADDQDLEPRSAAGGDGDARAGTPASPPDDRGFAGASAGDDIGAYLLDALPAEERRAFEAFLAASPEAQVEARYLAPVVALLPKVFDLLEPDAAAPAAGADLRDRIVAAAEAERLAPAEPDRAESDPVPISRPARDPAAVRPRGRIRGGVVTAPGTPAPTPIQSLASVRRLPMGWLSAAALAVVAVGAVIWALALQGRIDDKNREIRAQATEVADLRQNANATAFSLSPSDAAAGTASGTILYSLQQRIGILYVNDLPPLAEDQVYQLWYLGGGSDAPVPGGTFRVDDEGNGVLVVDPDTPTYDGVALTQEPEGGSTSPTMPILLQGALAGAAG